jgi:hypothetical protein
VPPWREETVAFLGAGSREYRRHVGPDDQPFFVDTPALDAAGAPIVNSAGEAFAVTMPACRHVEISGAVADVDALRRLAKRGGALVGDRAWAAFPDVRNWRFSDGEERWWWLLFELAWFGNRVALRAERRIWLSDTTYVAHDPRILRARSEYPLKHLSFPDAWRERLPEAWLGEIEDAAQASVDLADVLVAELGTRHEPSPAHVSPTEASTGNQTEDSSTTPSKPTPPRALRAHSQYEMARQTLDEPNPTDDQVYDAWVEIFNERMRHSRLDPGDELLGRDAWKRNLREYRRLTNTQKNTPRGGRGDGSRSVRRQRDE